MLYVKAAKGWDEGEEGNLLEKVSLFPLELPHHPCQNFLFRSMGLCRSASGSHPAPVPRCCGGCTPEGRVSLPCRHVRVGAGSVVLKNLPANTTAVGVPAEVVRVRGSQSCPADDLDQQALPDVLSNRISALEARLSRMEAAMQGEYPPDKPRFAAPEMDGVPPQDPHTEE